MNPDGVRHVAHGRPSTSSASKSAKVAKARRRLDPCRALWSGGCWVVTGGARLGAASSRGLSPTRDPELLELELELLEVARGTGGPPAGVAAAARSGRGNRLSADAKWMPP